MEIRVGKSRGLIRVVFLINHEPDTSLGGYGFPPDPPEVYCFDLKKDEVDRLIKGLISSAAEQAEEKK